MLLPIVIILHLNESTITDFTYLPTKFLPVFTKWWWLKHLLTYRACIAFHKKNSTTYCKENKNNHIHSSGMFVCFQTEIIQNKTHWKTLKMSILHRIIVACLSAFVKKCSTLYFYDWLYDIVNRKKCKENIEKISFGQQH